MKTSFNLLLFSFLILTYGCSQKSDRDLLNIYFDRPADFFEETFVIGNGAQGAIIYGDPYCERISLNDITLWSGQPDTAVYNHDAANYIPSIREALAQGDLKTAEALQFKMQGHNSQYYQPVGNVFINFNDSSDVKDYERRLDLNTAVATTAYSRGDNRIVTRYIASAPDSVIAVNIKSDKPVDIDLSFESLLPYSLSSGEGTLTANGYAPYGFEIVEENGMRMEKMLFDPNKGIHFSVVIDAVCPEAVISNKDNFLSIRNGKDIDIYISIATNFAGAFINPASSKVDNLTAALLRSKKAHSQSFNDILKRHIADYSNYFSRVSLDLGTSPDSLRNMPTDKRLKSYTDNRSYDPDLEELYFQYGRYLLISCSRTPGVPANLQGLWNEYTFAPWRSNYTININLQENYWPAEVTNLSEMHLPLLSFILNLQKTGETTAREYYGVDGGWCAGHNSDIWAMTCPVGHGFDQPMWANWNMGGAWIASHIWQHYIFTKDKTFLKEYYPALRGAAEFCLNWMIENNEGQLITSPSTSPENRFLAPDGTPLATSAGGTADLAMIRECLTDAKKAAVELNTDKDLVEKIDEALGKMAPYKIDSKGRLMEWAEEYREEDPYHRHQSHLYGLFPGSQISPEMTPELAEGASKALQIKGDNTTGWSTGWRINLLARLKNAPRAYAMYRRLLQYVSPDRYEGDDKRTGGGTYPNLLDAHAPFQIDGNFGGTAGVAEMLIQSTPETITLLPAIPNEWATGSFKGLKARGAFTLDVSWAAGKVRDFTIKSDEGGSTTVKVNGNEFPITLKRGESKKIKL